MEVYLQKGNDLIRVNWLSSLPEKYYSQITEKVKEMEKTQGNLENHGVFRVILNVDDSSKERKMKSQKIEDKKMTYVIQNASVSQGDATMIKVDMPQTQPPQHKSQPQLFLRESGKLKQKKSSNLMEKAPGNGSIPLRELGDDLKEILKFPTEFYTKQDEIGSSYSVKYLGITEGKIGILTKRVPMNKNLKAKILPERSAMMFHPRLKPLSPLTVSSFPLSQPPTAKIEVTETNENPPEPIPQIPQEEVVPEYIPIQATSINAMYTTGNYLEHKPESQIETIPERKNPKAKKSKSKKKHKKKPLKQAIISAPQVLPPLQPEATQISKPVQKPFRPIESRTQIHYYPQTVKKVGVPTVKEIAQPAPAAEPLAKEEGLIPRPELYNQPMIHTYSFPKALPVYRKTKVYSESEQFFGEKYSKESVASAVYQKTSGIYPSKMTGFKGMRVPTGELAKTKQIFSKPKINSLNRTNIKADNISLSSQPQLRTQRLLIPLREKPAQENPPVPHNVPFKEQTQDILKNQQIGNTPTQQPSKVPETEGISPLFEQLKKQKTDPMKFVEENNKLIKMLLEEGNKKKQDAVGKIETIGEDMYFKEQSKILPIDEERLEALEAISDSKFKSANELYLQYLKFKKEKFKKN